jgi:hypothetical protein
VEVTDKMGQVIVEELQSQNKEWKSMTQCNMYKSNFFFLLL